MALPTEADILACLGMPIGKICENGFDSIAESHRAHFVSHALGIQAGTLCGDLKAATWRTGATIRSTTKLTKSTKEWTWT